MNADIGKGLTDYEAQMNVDMRRGFLKKVLVTVFLQLLLTTGIVYAICSFQSVLDIFLKYSYPILIVSSIGAIAMACCAHVIHGHPQDFLFITLFTVFESMMVASCCVFVDKQILISAFLTTTGVVLALTLYALFTKTDFTGCGPYLYGALWILLLIGILSYFRIFPANVYAYLGTALFCVYLIYDIQMCVGSEKFGNEFSVDDYVIAALNIYLDIIQIFLYILQLMNSRD